MRTLTFIRIAAALLLGAAAITGFAAPRTFVASFGNDANPCTLAAPCRTFQAGINAVDVSGEVVALDSAGYGPIQISKSVTVAAASGVYAAMTAPSGRVVSIGAGTEVNLRGLRLIGQGAQRGIVVAQGARVVLEDVLVSEMIDVGISVEGVSNLTLSRVRIENNHVAGLGIGVWVVNGASLTMSDSVVTGQTNMGLYALSFVAGTPTRVMVSDSVFSGNSSAIVAHGATVVGAQVRVVAVRNVIQGSPSSAAISADCTFCLNSTNVRVIATDNSIQTCGAGIIASSNATVVASGNTVTDCATGLQQGGTGVLVTMGNNIVDGNTNPTSGIMTDGTLNRR